MGAEFVFTPRAQARRHDLDVIAEAWVEAEATWTSDVRALESAGMQVVLGEDEIVVEVPWALGGLTEDLAGFLIHTRGVLEERLGWQLEADTASGASTDAQVLATWLRATARAADPR